MAIVWIWKRKTYRHPIFSFWQDFIKNDHLTNLTQSRKSCVAQESNPGHCITGNQLNHSTLIRTAKGFSMIKSHVSAREQTYFLELLLKFCQLLPGLPGIGTLFRDSSVNGVFIFNNKIANQYDNHNQEAWTCNCIGEAWILTGGPVIPQFPSAVTIKIKS
jgi:hypothetical protein